MMGVESTTLGSAASLLTLQNRSEFQVQALKGSTDGAAGVANLVQTALGGGTGGSVTPTRGNALNIVV